MSADLLDFTAAEFPPVWRVLAVGACLVSSGAAGAALAAWPLQMLADRLSSHNTLVVELRARCQQRLRAVSAALAAVVVLALAALVMGVAA
ncbi:hypothetical protein [Actinomadura nitritigenes]|uniref:hypothetical protein n=1 Tax=Actinomadura nitritigenes TaxID=134602 RepID=UPI003D944FC5